MNYFKIVKKYRYFIEKILTSLRFIFILILIFFLNISFANRIITLAPNITELVYKLGSGKDIVGVSSYSDFPKSAKFLPIVSNYTYIDIEKILYLHPKLIIGELSNGKNIQWNKEFKKFKISSFWLSINKISDISQMFSKLGKLLKKENTAKIKEKYIKNIFDKIILYKRRKKDKIPKVLLQISYQPIFVASGNSIQTKIICFCGGNNIYYKKKKFFIPIEIEDVLKKNPDILFVMNNFQKKFWEKKWPILNAVKKNHIYILHPNWILRSGPRLIYGLKEICTFINSFYKKS